MSTALGCIDIENSLENEIRDNYITIFFANKAPDHDYTGILMYRWASAIASKLILLIIYPRVASSCLVLVAM